MPLQTNYSAYGVVQPFYVHIRWARCVCVCVCVAQCTRAHVHTVETANYGHRHISHGLGRARRRVVKSCQRAMCTKISFERRSLNESRFGLAVVAFRPSSFIYLYEKTVLIEAANRREMPTFRLFDWAYFTLTINRHGPLWRR